MPDKKSALSKAAQKTAKPAPAKKAAPAPRRELAAKKAPPKPAKAAKAAPVKAPKPTAKLAPAAKAAKPAAAKKAEAAAKVAPKPQPAPKTKAPKAEAKVSKPIAKAAPKTAKPTPKGKPLPAETKSAKPAPAAKAKPEKPAKPAKPPKAEKPPKLAPVAAALAKPMPAKPLAVAAGRATPVLRSTPAPAPRSAPKPLSAPKPAAPEPEVVGELQAVPAFKAKSGAKGMVLVGAIAGAFGVKGEVRLRAFTEKRHGVISYGPLYGEDGKILLKPKNWRELKDGVAVVAPEVKTREQAEKLKGRRLFVPRANLPPTAEDEFYIVDLLGCEAEALDGQVLGKVVAVWNFGAGDIIEYRPPNGGPNVRVSFTKETAPLVDLAGRRVVLDPPAPEPVGK